MVGFSLMHIHPGFFAAGILSSYLLIFWLVPASVYLAVNRRRISAFDTVMLSLELVCCGSDTGTGLAFREFAPAALAMVERLAPI